MAFNPRDIALVTSRDVRLLFGRAGVVLLFCGCASRKGAAQEETKKLNKKLWEAMEAKDPSGMLV